MQDIRAKKSKVYICWAGTVGSDLQIHDDKSQCLSDDMSRNNIFETAMECAAKAVFINLETQAKLLLIAKVWVCTEVASYMHATRACAIRNTLEKLKALHQNVTPMPHHAMLAFPYTQVLLWPHYARLGEPFRPHVPCLGLTYRIVRWNKGAIKFPSAGTVCKGLLSYFGEIIFSL